MHVYMLPGAHDLRQTLNARVITAAVAARSFLRCQKTQTVLALLCYD
jgi:hypothetical protein